jgi:hypothetical protein
MTLTVLIILAALALITCVFSISNKIPIWVPVLLLCIFALCQVIPLGAKL